MNVEETLEAIRNMPWVISFQIHFRRSKPRTATFAAAYCQDDGMIHSWIWYAVVSGEEYGEQIDLPNGEYPHPLDPDLRPADVLPLLAKRAHTCLENLEPGAGG